MEKISFFLKRIAGLGKRIIRGENILISKRASSQWDAQFKQGKWDYLVEDIPPNTKKLVEMIETAPFPRRILDVGCGNGGLYFALKQKGATVDYVGIDYSSEAIAQAKIKFPEATFFVGDATAPKEEWGKDFDVIVFNEVLYYVPALSTLEKYPGALSPKGITIVSMYRSWRTILLGIFLKYKKLMEILVIPSERGYPSFLILYR